MESHHYEIIIVCLWICNVFAFVLCASRLRYLVSICDRILGLVDALSAESTLNNSEDDNNDDKESGDEKSDTKRTCRDREDGNVESDDGGDGMANATEENDKTESEDEEESKKARVKEVDTKTETAEDEAGRQDRARRHAQYARVLSHLLNRQAPKSQVSELSQSPGKGQGGRNPKTKLER